MKAKDRILNYLICLYIIIQPLIPYNSLKLGRIPISGDLILAVVILVYLINILLFRDNRKRFVSGFKNFFSEPMTIFMFILAAMMFFSVTYAVEKKLALSESIRFATYVILYFIIKYECNCKRYTDLMIKCYISTSSVVAVLGILQYIMGYKLKDVYGIKRITSTLDNPNNVGAYIILILFPLIVLTIKEREKIKKALYGALIILLIINIVLAGSRNSMVGVGIGLVVLAFYNWKFLYAMFGGGVLALALPKVRNRIMDLGSSTQNISRIKYWKTALKMIKDHPLLGVGNGNYVSLYDSYVKKYPELRYEYVTRYPSHNSYLKVESELGIIGIVSFIYILAAALIKVKRFVSESKDSFYKNFYLGFLASMVVFYFMNIMDNLFFVPKTTVYFWIILAIAQASSYREKIQ